MEKGSHHRMKKSLALSFALHFILFSWGIIHFTPSSSFMQQPLEIAPITLSSLDKELAFQEGSLNAPPLEDSAPKRTTQPQEKEDARHFGEGTMDLQTPFQPKEKLQHMDATPFSFGQQEASDIPESSPKTETESLLHREPKLTKNEMKTSPPKSESTDQTVSPTALEQIKPEDPLQKTLEELTQEKPNELTPTVMLPDNIPFPSFKPKEKPIKPSNFEKTQKSPSKGKQTIEDILAMEETHLINRARTQGGGAKRSHKPEALGARKNIGDSAKKAQTLVNIVGTCIQQKLKLVAIGGNLSNRPVVRLQFRLNNNGNVIGEPKIDPLKGEESQLTIMTQQVYAAVFSCQPYENLPRDQYNLWGQGFDFNVDPFQETAP
ncbi:cell envelope biogenesis protein TolA [Bartonella sp. AR 15-3]|uniref:cell envelope biogenesis protein TolA n=1 Tax=Bartonella sp. AR 15-3 TaxID=545617 RepID=UPI0001F4BBAB|nr:cell envelope biogenesis protein TolA [Bartonella sp. AR 15-3]OPB32243.1 Cell division and transport-associated protein TolA [Bartonella sp. AR 15-3]CBI79898.1 TolA protein [Bartonella sp. AR 15-3]